MGSSWGRREGLMRLNRHCQMTRKNSLEVADLGLGIFVAKKIR